VFKLVQKLFDGTGSTPEPVSATSIRCSRAIVQYCRVGHDAVYLGDLNVTNKLAIVLLGPGKDADAPDRIPLESNGVGNNMDLQHIYILATHGEGVDVYYEEF
jgi:hypothetical protein